MTTIVIGHGRSPEGRGWGGKIDSCEIVIRMWDWRWQPFIDYGSKYDYGLFMLTPKGIQIFNEYNETKPQRGWLAYMGKPTPLGLLPKGVPVELVDTAHWVDAAVAMGGAGLSGKLTLTRGTAAAAWAIQEEKERVILVGFDNVACGINRPIEESFCPDYWNLYMGRFDQGKDKYYPIGQSKTATHDMAVEMPLLQKLASRRGVRLEIWW
jgi:hypothetical protein